MMTLLITGNLEKSQNFEFAHMDLISTQEQRHVPSHMLIYCYFSAELTHHHIKQVINETGTHLEESWDLELCPASTAGTGSHSVNEPGARNLFNQTVKNRCKPAAFHLQRYPC